MNLKQVLFQNTLGSQPVNGSETLQKLQESTFILLFDPSDIDRACKYRPWLPLNGLTADAKYSRHNNGEFIAINSNVFILRTKNFLRYFIRFL